MLMGVVCTVDSRFCAVTTISWIWSDLFSSCAKATFAPAPQKTHPDSNPSIFADIFLLIASPHFQLCQKERPAVDRMLHERGRECSIGEMHSATAAPPVSNRVLITGRLDVVQF